MKSKLENIILLSVLAIAFNLILSNTAAACSSGSCVQACATGYTYTGESCTVVAADLSMPGVCCIANSTTSTAYTNQEKIPGYDPTNCFPDYMKQIINFGFATIGILAMFMLAIGAYQYLMSAGNIGSAESAKATIGSALGGLALGLCAYLILNTINPDLVSMKNPDGLNCNATTTTTQNGTANTANKTYSNVAVSGTTKERIEQYNAIIKEASQKYNVPENVIKAMIDQESSGKANAGSSAGARGLMQLMPDTARGLGVTDITDPSQNIMAGTKFFSQMYSKYGNTEDALGAYNCGPGRYNQYLNGTRALPTETQRYIPSVMGKSQSY